MKSFLIKEWLFYFHLKTDEHSLHSPFFYNFYNSIIKDNKQKSLDKVEDIRSGFLRSEEQVELHDLGAGSHACKSNTRRISSIAKHSLTNKKCSCFILSLIKHFDLRNIIELGTSLGINTAYMASYGQAKIKSFEGDPNILRLAKQHLSSYSNIELIEGNITYTLEKHLKDFESTIDLAYMDANHTYEATLNYFEEMFPYFRNHSICILDDIHWSKGMKQAWEKLKTHTGVTSSIDLFDVGILFFNPDLKHQQLVLDF